MTTGDSADARAPGARVRADESTPAGGEATLASLGSRAIAHVLDVAIVFAVIGGTIAVATGQTTPTGYQLTGGPALAWFGTSLGYFVVLEAWPGQTVGKRALGIAVREESGEQAGLVASLVRNLLRVVDVLFFYAVGLILAADSERNQRLGDRVADTVVVETG